MGWSESANSYTVVYDNGHSGYACGFNSQGDVEIFMQATGEPGWFGAGFARTLFVGYHEGPVKEFILAAAAVRARVFA